MATALYIQLEARKVSDPVLLRSPNPEDRLLMHDIVASLNFSPRPDLILFQGGDRFRRWMRRVQKRGSCMSVLIACRLH